MIYTKNVKLLTNYDIVFLFFLCYIIGKLNHGGKNEFKKEYL